jgi:hypothetical protein
LRYSFKLDQPGLHDRGDAPAIACPVVRTSSSGFIKICGMELHLEAGNCCVFRSTLLAHEQPPCPWGECGSFERIARRTEAGRL